MAQSQGIILNKNLEFNVLKYVNFFQFYSADPEEQQSEQLYDRIVTNRKPSMNENDVSFSFLIYEEILKSYLKKH